MKALILLVLVIGCGSKEPENAEVASLTSKEKEHKKEKKKETETEPVAEVTPEPVYVDPCAALIEDDGVNHGYLMNWNIYIQDDNCTLANTYSQNTDLQNSWWNHVDNGDYTSEQMIRVIRWQDGTLMRIASPTR